MSIVGIDAGKVRRPSHFTAMTNALTFHAPRTDAVRRLNELVDARDARVREAEHQIQFVSDDVPEADVRKAGKGAGDGARRRTNSGWPNS